MSAEGLQGIATIFQGVQQRKEFEDEARDEKKQAAIIARESEEEAARVKKANVKKIKKQKLQLLKAGITLEDSPLLVLEESFEESRKEVGAIKRRGQARAQFRGRRARRLKKRGRTAFITGALVGAGQLASAAKASEEESTKK